MEKLEITRVTIKDVELLQKIAKQTFAETYSWGNSEVNMNEYLENEFSIDKLKLEVSNKNAIFYFALHKQEVIGYLKVNFGASQTEIKDENAIEIERIYVFEEFQGKKVGQLLCEKAITIAKNKKVDYVWLGVWENNQRAIQFYKNNGFFEFDTHIFKLGDDEQTDIMMKLWVH